MIRQNSPNVSASPVVGTGAVSSNFVQHRASMSHFVFFSALFLNCCFSPVHTIHKRPHFDPRYKQSSNILPVSFPSRSHWSVVKKDAKKLYEENNRKFSGLHYLGYPRWNCMVGRQRIRERLPSNMGLIAQTRQRNTTCTG